jgi:hypothetical protein
MTTSCHQEKKGNLKSTTEKLKKITSFQNSQSKRFETATSTNHTPMLRSPSLGKSQSTFGFCLQQIKSK